jgi:hypothetical protein
LVRANDLKQEALFSTFPRQKSAKGGKEFKIPISQTTLEKKPQKTSGHPGQGKDMNLAGSRFAEDAGALLDCSPGGKDVVDEENSLSLHGFRFSDFEGSAHVLAPFGSGQLGLGLGLPGSAECGEGRWRREKNRGPGILPEGFPEV